MDIRAAWMLGPNAGFTLQDRGLKGMVLLDAQITHRMAGLMQGADELWSVVEECLAPLGMAGSNGQHPPLQGQGATVRSQLCSGNPGPVLPQRGQMIVFSPSLLQRSQTLLQGFCGWWCSRLEQLQAR